MGLFRSFMRSIMKISRPIFSFDNNKLIFKIESDHFYTYNLENYEVKTRHDPYVHEAYTLQTDKLFIEYINTDADVEWDGLSSSHFISLVKDQLNIKKVDVLESFDFAYYDFSSYRVDNDYVMNFIHISEMGKDVFILDFEGGLYTNLLRSLKKDYEYKYEKNPPLNLDLNFSLVKDNSFYNYFSYGD